MSKEKQIGSWAAEDEQAEPEKTGSGRVGLISGEMNSLDRNKGFSRGSGNQGLSREEDVGNWRMGKKPMNVFDGGNRGTSRDGGSDGVSRADAVDKWTVGKKHQVLEAGPVRSSGPGRWIRGGVRGGSEQRTRLEKPRSDGVVNEIRVSKEGGNRPNLFGAARPREEVLSSKGLDWKKIDLDFERRRLYSSKPTGGADGPSFGSDNASRSGHHNHESITVRPYWTCTLCSSVNSLQRTSCFQCKVARRDDDPPTDSSNHAPLGRRGDIGRTNVLVVRRFGEKKPVPLPILIIFSEHAPIKDYWTDYWTVDEKTIYEFFIHFYSIDEATKALEATKGTISLQIDRKVANLPVAYAKSIIGPVSGPSQSSSLVNEISVSKEGGNRPNPFGAARPREELLSEKGLDWRKVDTEIEAKRGSSSRVSTGQSRRPGSAQSEPAEGGPALPQGVMKPKVNPFGDAKPREVLLEEKGLDWKKIDLNLERRRVNR